LGGAAVSNRAVSAGASTAAVCESCVGADGVLTVYGSCGEVLLDSGVGIGADLVPPRKRREIRDTLAALASFILQGAEDGGSIPGFP